MRHFLLISTALLAFGSLGSAYASVDLYLTWKPSFIQALRLDMGIDNIFDKNYARVLEGVSEPGRNYKTAVSFQKGL